MAESAHEMKERGDIEPAADWPETVDRALAEGWRRLLVLGGTDSGKSAFCRFLSAALLRRGRRIAFIDADLGQKTIGPPAAIALGYPALDMPIADTPPAGFFFIGSVNPARYLELIVSGTAALANSARADVVVIDTDGMVTPPALRSKARLVEAVRPDVMILIERGEELAALRRATEHAVVRLSRSAKATRKSSRRRAAARRHAFAAYFHNAANVDFGLSDLALEPVRPDAETRLEPYRLCGTLDAEGRGSGLALVDAIDHARHMLRLRTPVPAAHIRALRLGELRLTFAGEPLRPFSLGAEA